MPLIVDEQHLGPNESQWTPVIRRMAPPPLDLSVVQRLVVLAPHPDDEVVGAGGLVRWALVNSVPMEIVIVTDGEGSHPRSLTTSTWDLATRRIRESEEALARLGWEQPVLTRLHLPDGNVARCESQLEEILGSLLGPNVWCAAPWRRDGHPDHDAVGWAALRVSEAIGTTLWSYLVWGWHWADPQGSDIPWSRARRLDLTRRDRARKRWALRAFETQISPLGPGSGDEAVLPARLLPRFWRASEIYLEEGVVSP